MVDSNALNPTELSQIHHLEFQSHPLMKEEELLACRFLTMFRACKQRETSNMQQFYEDRLLGLEDALLEVRHQLMATQVCTLCSAM
jgi:hypothetical protein